MSDSAGEHSSSSSSSDSSSDDEQDIQKTNKDGHGSPSRESEVPETAQSPEHKDQELDFEAEEKEPSEDGEASDGEIDNPKAVSDAEEVEEGEDLEEGEVTDDEDFGKSARMEPRALCKFFTKGQCTWGINCRFLHPGVSDKGNYSMFSTTVKPVAVPGSRPLSEMAPVWDDHMPPPPPSIPVEDSPWERALREAKERLKKANIRRETDEEFEEKKFNLGMGDHELEKEADYYARVPSPPRNDFDDLGVPEEEDVAVERERARRPPPPPNPYEDDPYRPVTGSVEVGRYEDPRRFQHYAPRGRGHYEGGFRGGYRGRGDFRGRGNFRGNRGRDTHNRDSRDSRSFTPRKPGRRRSYSSGSSYSSSSSRSRSRSSSFSGSSSRSSSRSPSPRGRRGPPTRGHEGGRGRGRGGRGGASGYVKQERRSVSPRPSIPRRRRGASSRSSSRSKSRSRSYSRSPPPRRGAPSAANSKLSAASQANQANLAAAAAAALHKKGGTQLPKSGTTAKTTSGTVPPPAQVPAALPAEAPKAPVRMKLAAVSKPGLKKVADKFAEESSDEEIPDPVQASKSRMAPLSPPTLTMKHVIASNAEPVVKKEPTSTSSKKRVAESPPPTQPKEKVSKESLKDKEKEREKDRRREELMKQLKAVEDAIAKKRSKIGT